MPPAALLERQNGSKVREGWHALAALAVALALDACATFKDGPTTGARSFNRKNAFSSEPLLTTEAQYQELERLTGRKYPCLRMEAPK